MSTIAGQKQKTKGITILFSKHLANYRPQKQPLKPFQEKCQLIGTPLYSQCLVSHKIKVVACRLFWKDYNRWKEKERERGKCLRCSQDKKLVSNILGPSVKHATNQKILEKNGKHSYTYPFSFTEHNTENSIL